MNAPAIVHLEAFIPDQGKSVHVSLPMRKDYEQTKNELIRHLKLTHAGAFIEVSRAWVTVS